MVKWSAQRKAHAMRNRSAQKCFQDGAPQVSRSHDHGRKWSSIGFEISISCAYTRERRERHPFETLLRETNHKKATSEV